METQEQRRKTHEIYLGLCFIYAKIPGKRKIYDIGNEVQAIKLASDNPEDEYIKRLSISSTRLNYHFILEDDTLRNTFKVFYKGKPIIKNTYIGSLFDDGENYYDKDEDFIISFLALVIEKIKKIL